MAGLHSIPGLCGLERSGLRPGPPLFHSHSLCHGYKQHLSMHRYLLNGCLSSLNLLTPDWNAYCAFHTWMDNRHLKFKIFGTEHLNSTPKPPPRSLLVLSQRGFHLPGLRPRALLSSVPGLFLSHPPDLCQQILPLCLQSTSRC